MPGGGTLLRVAVVCWFWLVLTCGELLEWAGVSLCDIAVLVSVGVVVYWNLRVV